MTSPLVYTGENACLVYLIRHGATPPNLEDPPVMQGRGIDASLAEIGREQARRAAQALSNRPLRAVYSSPLARAKETAQAVAGPHGLDVITEQALIEVDPGRWEGLSWPQIEQEEPELYHAFRNDPGSYGYPEGETLTQVAERVVACFDRLMRAHLGEEIAIVAHSVVNRVYLGRLLGLTLAGGRKIPQENCAINLVRLNGDRAKAITVNGVSHLMTP